MQLAILLEEARNADPQHRIEWRDPIATFGERAITEVQPWLADPALAAFAIRVIGRVGEQGQAELATHALGTARRLVPRSLWADLDWALGRLRPVRSPGAARSRTSHPNVATPRRTAPRNPS